MMDRRDFLRHGAAFAAAGLALPGLARAAFGGTSPIGFSTLGCPRWDWTTILDFAAAHGFTGIELRGIRETIDLTKCAEFQPERIATSMEQLAARGLAISDLGASANLHEADTPKGAAGMAEARGFVDLAARLRVPYVRVFGNKYIAGATKEETFARVGAALRSLGEYARERNVTVLLETHGDFTDSPAVLEIITRADSRGAAVLWDAHHTFAFGKEDPETSVRMLGSYIRHVHLKDSLPAGTDRKYVLTGEGDVPIRRQIAALKRAGYAGFYNFEWEKRWHPEIEEPEVAFAQFAERVIPMLQAS